jgi:zinc and cadmium transporter
LLFYFGLGEMAHAYEGFLGAVLAFCAGTFLCIACSDLLPELQFHLHDRTKLSLSLVAGIAVAVLIATFGHVDHGHEAEPHDHTEELHSH